MIQVLNYKSQVKNYLLQIINANLVATTYKCLRSYKFQDFTCILHVTSHSLQVTSWILWI